MIKICKDILDLSREVGGLSVWNKSNISVVDDEDGSVTFLYRGRDGDVMINPKRGTYLLVIPDNK